MKHSIPILLALIVFTVLVVSCSMKQDDSTKERPNILYIMSDDLRYIYTLEQTIEERRGSGECTELVNESEKFLQEVWNSIKVQQKYLKSDMWPSAEFNMIRWKMAQYISALLEYSPVASVMTPSVPESIEKLQIN